MSESERREADYVPLGYISGVHGLKGWVKVYSWTQPREAILNYQPWFIGEDRRQVQFRAGRLQGKNLLVALPEVDDRESARNLVSQEIAVRREQLPPLAAGEYYWTDLVGLDVVTVDGTLLGKVDSLLETGANDVLVVRGERERLIPYVPGRYVTRVESEKGRIVVDWQADF